MKNFQVTVYGVYSKEMKTFPKGKYKSMGNIETKQQ